MDIRLIDRVNTALRRYITRGLIAAIAPRGGVLIIDVNTFAGAGISGAELMVHHGLWSRPKNGTPALILFPTAKQSSGFVIGTRGVTPPGTVVDDAESAIYTANGDYVMLDGTGSLKIKLAAGFNAESGGDAEIKASSLNVTAPNVTFSTATAITASTAAITCLNVTATGTVAAAAVAAAGMTITPPGADAIDVGAVLMNIKSRLTSLEESYRAHTHAAPNGATGSPLPSFTPQRGV